MPTAVLAFGGTSLLPESDTFIVPPGGLLSDVPVMPQPAAANVAAASRAERSDERSWDFLGG